ncbi:hypothetical protein IW146_000997 [Coemansia sp. RSA 922]|nr:hypothetical protein H4S03_006428 [Coemansia sp. S3946]KAJ2070745.1 hypothetical protein GGH13_003813 [Coemansia sp. S155-1]KAJ2117125.1 hypothetical protein IW146_000997 [Coemansia sp. RSA 922]
MMRAVDVSVNTPMEVKLSIRISFGVLLALYLGTGIAAISVGGYFIHTEENSRRSIIVTKNVIALLFVAGAYIILNALVGIIAGLSPLSRKRWLQAYVWLIVIIMFVETGVGIWLWLRTLDIDDLYGHNWRHLWSDSFKRTFQDSAQCCGYLGPLDGPVMASPSCQLPSDRAFGCMTSVQKYAQSYLTYIYTGVFVLVFLSLGAMISGMILMIVRNDEERWRWTRANAIFRSMNYDTPDSTITDKHRKGTPNQSP